MQWKPPDEAIQRDQSEVSRAPLTISGRGLYETFGEDAIAASKVLDIVLTKRGNGSVSEIELAGFPHHSWMYTCPNWCVQDTGLPSVIN